MISIKLTNLAYIIIYETKKIPIDILKKKPDKVKEYINYSYFKYGSIESTNYFANLLLETLRRKDFDFFSDEVYFSSTFFSGTPSACHYLRDVLVDKINKEALLKGHPSVHKFDFLQRKRKSSFKDYGKLNFKERQKSQKQNNGFLCIPQIRDSSKLVIVNDISVTGSQLTHQQEVLTSIHLPKNIIYLFIYTLDEEVKKRKDTLLENKLNNYAFKSSKRFSEFLIKNIETRNIYINKRLILKLLNIEDIYYKKIIEKFDQDFKNKFLSLALNDNMHIVSKYRKRLLDLNS